MSNVKTQIAHLLDTVTIADIPGLVSVDMKGAEDRLVVVFTDFYNPATQIAACLVQQALEKAGYGTYEASCIDENEMACPTNMPWGIYENWCRSRGRT